MKIINTVGVVGAGTMGAALAQKFAQEGFNVILFDKSEASLQKGIEGIRNILQQGVDKQIFPEQKMEATLANINGTTNLHEAQSCDLIVEAIFENFEAKAELFRQLDKIIDEDTIVATNTSSFSVTELSAAISHPERFIGLHYFFHAAKNRLVEIIPGEKTSSVTFKSMQVFSVLSGKDAISCKDAYGFVVNRYFVPWLNESARLLEEGVANKGTIDHICMKTFGIGMGPFALMNATGVPVSYHAQKTLEVFGGFYKPSEALRKQTELNQPWDIEAVDPESIIPEVERVVSERMLGVIFLVCSQLLDEEVCQAVDINRGARIGLRWRRGPVEMMQRLGEEEVKRLIGQICDKYKVDFPASVGQTCWEMEYVRLEKHKDIAVIKMDRPEDMNALNQEVVRQLDTRFSKANNDPEVKTIFLTGSGKAFVAGADVKFFVKNIQAGAIDKIETFTKYCQEVFNKIDQSEKKVVAVVNGLTLGGGLELALCADVILSVPKATFAFPETGIGIYPGLGGTQRPQKRIGKALTKYLIFTGDMISAIEAQKIGLVDSLVSPLEAFEIMDGSLILPSPKGGPEAQVGKYASIEELFSKNSLENFLKGKISNGALEEEAIEKIVKKVKRKAPVALKVADKLITEAKGCESELEELSKVFSSEDALLGLSSIGKKVEFNGR